MWYTFLNNEGARVEMLFKDCRPTAASGVDEYRVVTRCDPRLTIVIDHGVAYSLRCEADMYIRAEQEVFVDDDEPRGDLPAFGEDMRMLEASERMTTPILPRIRCPGSLVRLLARQELEYAEGLTRN
jgi:hypothetical protein